MKCGAALSKSHTMHNTEFCVVWQMNMKQCVAMTLQVKLEFTMTTTSDRHDQ